MMFHLQALVGDGTSQCYKSVHLKTKKKMVHLIRRDWFWLANKHQWWRRQYRLRNVNIFSFSFLLPWLYILCRLITFMPFYCWLFFSHFSTFVYSAINSLLTEQLHTFVCVCVCFLIRHWNTFLVVECLPKLSSLCTQCDKPLGHAYVFHCVCVFVFVCVSWWTAVFRHLATSPAVSKSINRPLGPEPQHC